MKKLILGILLILFIGSFINDMKVFMQGSWLDFGIYYHSAQAATRHINPYIITEYIYTPFCLLLFYPFTVVPLIIASQIWIIISIVSLITAIWLLLKMYKATSDLILIFTLGILICNFFPVKFTLASGQINTIILLLIVMAMYVGKQKKEGIVGALLGLALTLKYTPLFILPYLLVRRKWRILVVLGITLIVLFILAFLVIDPKINIYYLQHVILSVSLSSSWTYYYNQALSGFLNRDFNWLNKSQLIIVRYVISLVMLAVSVYVVLKRKPSARLNTDLEISVFLTLNLLLNTFSEQHHFVLMIIPLLVTFFVLRQNKLKWYYYAILVGCYTLTALNMKNPSAFPIFLQSHVFYGALGLWVFDLYLLWKPSIKLDSENYTHFKIKS